MVSNPTTPMIEVAGKQFSRQADSEVLKELNLYQGAKTARRRERAREFENLKTYAGIDNSQWPDDLQSFLMQENRGTNYGDFTHLGTYNFVKMKLNGIAGSIVRNPFDATFVADEIEDTQKTMALQAAYMSDKELMDWIQYYHEAVRLGNIYQSVLRMHVKTDHPASPMGNIAIECMPPGSCIVDPNWKQLSSKELNHIWVLGYYTADQLKAKYEMKRDLIERELWLLSQFGPQYKQDEIDWNKDIPDIHGSQFLVVEHHYLEEEKVEREFDPVTGTVFWEWMSDEQKRDIAMEKNIDPTNITTIKVRDNVAYTKVTVPGLTQAFFAVNQKDEFQVGRLLFFPWATEYVNGKPSPMMDQLRDAQLEFNKRQSQITNAAEAAINSPMRVDEAILNGADAKEELKQNIGNPRYVLFQKRGTSRAFPDAVSRLHDGNNIPGDLFGIANQMVDLMDRLVPQPAASEGRTERSGESGILYAQKVEVAKTMQTTMLAGIKQLWNDLAESYFFLAKQLYSQGRREFTDAKGSFKVVVNDPQINILTGEERIANDFSTLSRHRVTISEAPSGVNNRLLQQELNSNLVQNYAQFAPNAAMTFMEQLINSLEMDEIQKQAALESVGLDRERLRAQTEAAIVAAQAQAQAAQQSVGQQPQQASEGAGSAAAEMAPGGAVEGAVTQQPKKIEPGIGNLPEQYMEARGLT